MNFKEIQELIKLINKSNLTEFKMKDGDFTLSIRTKKYGRGKAAQIIQPQQQIVPVQTTMPVQSMAPAPIPLAKPDLSSKNPVTSGEDTSKETNNYIEVKSPIVGTFYRAPSPDESPYIEVNSVINVGSVVCVVEAMKLFNEIESEVSGKVVKIMVDDASPVEYDQVLFLVDPKG